LLNLTKEAAYEAVIASERALSRARQSIFVLKNKEVAESLILSVQNIIDLRKMNLRNQV
jgi:hypothetical protein